MSKITKATKNNVYFAKIKEKAILPSKKDENAGYDLYACFDEDYILLEEFETKPIPTGIAWACSEDYYMQFYERSSTGVKGIKYSAGVIDCGYRGEFKIAIFNATRKKLIFTYLDNEVLFEKYPEFKDENIYLVYNCKKAIAQGIIHRVNKMKIHELSYEDLLLISSERKDKWNGSSNKL